MKKVLMVCNAHIDPVWQWNWDEGLFLTVSTFRSVVNLAEEFDYVFAHNEAMLYQWIEEHEPDLFAQIKSLVECGKWKIMGGWYLQPDCNLPSCESMIRQIQRGKKYFSEKFGTRNTTAVNLDSFGHGGGLPQILKLCGYDSYVCCRPMPGFSDYPDEFIWEGVDGSRVKVLRMGGGYNSPLGKALDKLKCEIERQKNQSSVICFWGVGNHGGGPSRHDLAAIRSFTEGNTEYDISYGIPEEYFLTRENENEPVFRDSLRPCFTGCYSSQAKIKSLHRKLENSLYRLEKLLVLANKTDGFKYPYKEIEEIENALLLTEFHDVLTGTQVKPAEEASIQRAYYGLELCDRLIAYATLAMTKYLPKVPDGCYPVVVFNPMPYGVRSVVEKQILLEKQYHTDKVILDVFDENGSLVSSQMVKEDSNIPIDWAKKTAFVAELKPMSVNLFYARERITEATNVREYKNTYGFGSDKGRITFDSEGNVASVTYNGVEFTDGSAFDLAIYSDNDDPWAMQIYQHRRLGEKVGSFALADEKTAGELNHTGPVPAIRLTESGDIYDCVEVIKVYGRSYAVMKYKLYRNLPYFDVDTEVFFAEKDALLKLLVPCRRSGTFCGDIAGGAEIYRNDGSERAMQKWVRTSDGKYSAAIINDCIYGVSAVNNVIELTLLRSPAYTSHYIDDTRKRLDEGRFNDRIAQGENRFSFRIMVGTESEVAANVGREAQLFNEKPYVCVAFPTGERADVNPEGVKISGDAEICMQACKLNERGEIVARLSNRSDVQKRCTVIYGNKSLALDFSKYEIKTVIINEDIRENTEPVI